MTKTDDTLDQAVWSRDLTPAELDRARAGLTLRVYLKDSTVCMIGEPFTSWMGVMDGLLKVRSVSKEGKEASFAGMHAGGWFGEGSILKNEVRRYEVIALRTSNIALLDQETFMWLFENSPAFSRFLVRQLNERLGHFIAQVEYDRLLGTTTRVARTLALLLNRVLYPDVGPSLKITQEEIGLLAGVTRSVTNQALKQLEAHGAIRIEYGGITVLNAELLRTIVE